MEQTREVLDDLLAGWNAMRTEITLGSKRRAIGEPQAAIVFSLAAHVHRQATAALILIDASHEFEAVPLIRSAYECAITAHWVAQTDDGANAIMNYHDNSLETFRQTAIASSMSSIVADEPERPDAIDPLPTTSRPQATSFKTRCDDLDGGNDLYLIYRYLSGLSHPSVVTGDQYLEADMDGDLIFRTFPKSPKNSAILHSLACSVIWAGRAVDYIEKARRRRNILRKAAQRIATRSDLQLTPAAMQRQAQFRTSQTRAKRQKP